MQKQRSKAKISTVFSSFYRQIKLLDWSDPPNHAKNAENFSLNLSWYSAIEHKLNHAKISCVPKIYLKKNQPCNHGDHTNTEVLIPEIPCQKVQVSSILKT